MFSHNSEGFQALRVSALIAFSVIAACAEEIVQPAVSFAGVFATPDAVKGQSFVVNEPALQSIGAYLQVLNPQYSANTSVSVSLYSGLIGSGGTLITTRSLMPVPQPIDTALWVDWDFSGVNLVPGTPYTFVLGAPNDYWGASYNQWTFRPPDYTGGQMLTPTGYNPILDLTFRVFTAVPEPGTTALLITGGVMLAAFGRKRRSLAKLRD